MQCYNSIIVLEIMALENTIEKYQLPYVEGPLYSKKSTQLWAPREKEHISIIF